MGWFSSSEKESAVSSRQDRKKCWEARDAYFSCLDRAGVVKAGDEGVACSSALKVYEKDCARSWVCAALSP
jgi:cytochrome c oxidase assembly factor 6